MGILDQIVSAQFAVMVLTAVAAFATVLSLIAPLLQTDRLEKRLKYVAVERNKMRAARMAELTTTNNRLRNRPKGFMQKLVEDLNLRELFEKESVRQKLKMAGMRGEAPMVGYLFFQAVLPVAGLGLAVLYMFILKDTGKIVLPVKIAVCLGAGYFGFLLPSIFLSNLIQRRQKAIKRAFPDSLDLLLICVQSGMSIEAAFAKVAKEIAGQCIELAEELSLTTAELSYLQTRRQAYENLGKRTGLPGVQAVCTALIQAEKYGTPLSQALRVMAQENREMRMAEAEKKAAALPPKLTVPMILFFLPVLFVVILGPAAMKVQGL